MTEPGAEIVAFPDGAVIDLRDPTVADGLADVLNQVSDLGERTGAAEAKAEAAFHDRLAATGKLRRITAEVEQERAERHRLEVDNAALVRENNVRLDQIHHLSAELDRTRQANNELVTATDDLIAWLQNELSQKQKANHTLEALINKRQRRNFERLMEGPADPTPQ